MHRTEGRQWGQRTLMHSPDIAFENKYRVFSKTPMVFSSTQPKNGQINQLREKKRMKIREVTEK